MIFKIAFALSPFPAYLPQYFSLIRQSAEVENEEAETRNRLRRSHGSQNALVEEQIVIDRGVESLRKRSNNTHSDSASPASTGLLIKSSTCDAIAVGSNKTPSSGAGLSRATVFLLLSSHLLRLLYFHGLMLQNETKYREESAAAAITISTTIIQWDLFGQSICMIIMQLLLLRAMTKIRFVNKRRDNDHSSPPLSSCYHHGHDATSGSIRRSMFTTTKVHFLRILSPHNILHNHSFLEYVELLFLCLIATKLLFDYKWYPDYQMTAVDSLKHASIILESCLALPQAMRNFFNSTTDGLSAIMIVGWVVGDFMKLFYFTSQFIWSKVTAVDDPGSIVFAAGCVFALALDFVVCIQMSLWYPSKETLEMKEKWKRSLQEFTLIQRSNQTLVCKCIRDRKSSNS